jgi:hypothetical protein
MNWSIYNNHEVSVILWSDGTKNAFYSRDAHMEDFISYKNNREQLTYTIERCMQSEYDVKYNGWSYQNDGK